MGRFFKFDHTLNESELCGLEGTKNDILTQIKRGNGIKIFGRRNFGKTSLIKNVIGHDWGQKKNQLFIYIDLYSVETSNDLSREFAIGLTDAIQKLPFSTTKIIQYLKGLKKIRPVYQISESGIELSLKSMGNNTFPYYLDILGQIDSLGLEHNLNILLVIDEFQEIVKIKGADETIRTFLENTKAKIIPVLMGSKQHMMTMLFSTPKAPLYNWGNTIEFHEIPYEDYHKYISKRFKKANVSLSLDNSIYLQNKLLREPEAINRFCDFLAEEHIDKNSIEIDQIDLGFKQIVEGRRSQYAEILNHYSVNEKKYLRFIATTGPITGPSGKNISLSALDISKEGLRKIHQRLYNQGTVIKIDTNFYIGDPLFSIFLKLF